ncbi:MAG: cryptochrome/photolyase family protein [Planctomycetes bacterium]|nr:cryptochrome/photolyase family protein [Planctomycetota bacterium]
MRAAIVYPHQLFPGHPAINGVDVVLLVEDPLFFQQYHFHAQKLMLHRASMRHYFDELRSTADIAPLLSKLAITHVQLVDPCDDWLEQRLKTALANALIKCEVLDDPHFLTPWSTFDGFAVGRSKWFFTDFYVQQRQRLELLVDNRGRPLGGKWSFDSDNRKKMPRDTIVPPVKWPATDKYVREVKSYVAKAFPQAVGDHDSFHYPVTTEQARACLEDFLDHRFAQFGDYEDAIHPNETFLFHSVLTPALNIGLISPKEVIESAIARSDQVPLNSLEGFVRQIIGWREYMRGVYRQFGRRQRTCNFWKHSQPMPAAFYDGTTGVDPVDTIIRRVLKHAYCHHIERLMILGNFMLLCEIDPDSIYQWFMELFIDSYDWVMVPNVYGMSQHADGGLITTKPYISGSSYVLKMSRFDKGPWCPIWDALYWRFINKHRDFFTANPRMSVMVAQCDRMGERLNEHLRIAESFLTQLHQQ